MISIKKTDTSITISDGVKTYNFPLNKILLTEDASSNSVNIKLLGSRKTILTLVDKSIDDFK